MAGSPTNLMPVAAPMTDQAGRITYPWQQWMLNPAFGSVILPLEGTPGTYGGTNATLTITVNQYGITTGVAANPISIANTQVTGLGTMAVENSNSVTITGGTIDGSAVGGAVPSTGLFTILQATGAIGFNGASAQGLIPSGGPVVTTGATNAAPFGYTTAAQADAIVTLLNTIRSALVGCGIMS